MVDNAGVNFKTWALTGTTGYSSYLLPGGTILRTVKTTTNACTGLPGDPICGQIQKVDYAGNIIWNYQVNGTDFSSHHDIAPMPNGNVLVIAYERKTNAQVAALGGTYTGATMWSDRIMELKPTGATTADVVWQWSIFDHTCQATDNTKPNYVPSLLANPQLININAKPASDWIHMNGVGYNEELDQIAFTSHNQNEIYIIDHSTTTAEATTHAGGKYGKGGDFLYRYGNPANYGATATQQLKVTHDAHWAPVGTFQALNLSAYNNQGISTNASAVDMVAAPLLPSGLYDYTAGQAYAPTTPTFRHAVKGYNSNMGGCQQLPNSQIHVTVATAGKMYTYDIIGDSVLFTKTITGSVAKSFRYTKCYVNGTLAATPTITKNGNVLTSSSATTYQWFKNGVAIAGATSQTYSPTLEGNYYVQTTGTDGCESPVSKAYSYAFPVAIDDVLQKFGVNIYPNPTSSILHIDCNYQQAFTVSILDGMGRLLITSHNNVIDVASLSNGIYFVAVQLENGQIAKTKFIKE